MRPPFACVVTCCLVLSLLLPAAGFAAELPGLDTETGDAATKALEAKAVAEKAGEVAGLTAERASEPKTTEPLAKNARILFLHHSTGNNVWRGGVAERIKAYNAANGTEYVITEKAFPKGSPYGWKNYPYDYWNIWVQNAGDKAFQEEPTLEMLTPDYEVIVFKHCYPVSNIEADTGKGDVASEAKTLENYKLQYAALKKKLHEFPKARFIVWTGAALTEGDTSEDKARRAKEFFEWVKTDWDEKGDNIFVWDFHTLETDGGLYLTKENSAGDSHPGQEFCKKAAPMFSQRIVDVVEGRGDTGSLTGELKADKVKEKADDATDKADDAEEKTDDVKEKLLEKAKEKGLKIDDMKLTR